MLGRASRSRLPPVTQNQKLLQHCYNDLYLPWLCPSLYGSFSCLRPSTTVAPQRTVESSQRTSKPVKLPRISSHHVRRGLASAAAEIYGEPSEDFIPWAHGSPFLDQAPRLFSHDPAPLVVENSCTTAPAIFRSYNGISGQLDEVHQSLHACLQVGRLERAAALMRRLNMIYKPTAPGLLAAHNEYLRELTWQITKKKDQQLLKSLQNWFEVNIRKNGVPPDSITYSLMIRASLNESDQKKFARTIKRYLELADEDGIYTETLDATMALLQDYEAEKLQEFVSDPANQTEAEEVIPPPADPSNTVKTDLPEIKSVQQKGLGLATLRRSLSMFMESKPLPPPEGACSKQPHATELHDELRQRRLEKDTYESALSRWREENMQQKKMGIDMSLSNSSIGALMWTWHEALVPLIKDEVRKANEAESKSVKRGTDKERCQYGPFLQILPPEKLSAATILTAMTTLSTEAKLEDGIKLVSLVMKIGSNIQDESLAETVRIQAQRGMKPSEVDRKVMRQAAAKIKQNPRMSYAKFLGPGERTSELLESLQWSRPLQAKVGSVLLAHLMEVAKVDVVSTRAEKPLAQERQPVFFHTFRYLHGKRNGIVKLNKAMSQKLTKEPVKSVLSKHLPMVVKPRPWTGFREGGFLEHSIPVLRIRGRDLGRRYGITACDNGDMDQTFAGLDILGKTPWRVNRPVFEAMVEAWNTGEAVAKIPALNPVVEQPPEPSKTLDDYPAQRMKWLRQLKAIENYKSGLNSVRCYLNFQLEIARAYVDQTFYLPHNLDFRGRAYPMSPLFNHMGADNVRGLLLFAEGKELGQNGLRWLKIHLANVYGHDKANFADREEFATNHLSDIRDSVENPMTGRKWWLKAEDPWQCLATCIEVQNALDSPDPSRFVSHLAVHQDGTCNGLQHYAALGGDSIGAKQVNLEPGDRPSDIYTAVAELVKAEVAKDAAQGNATAQMLDGRITRKVVKQTVMTNVYGVTFLGATRQVRKQLDDMFATTPSTQSIDVHTAAFYVAKKIFAALSTMFNGAHDIQHWLGICASRISESLSPEQIDVMLGDPKEENEHADFKRPPSVRKSIEGPTTFKTPVIWTNPLRMPVVQPYRKVASQEVTTNLQTVSLQIASSSDPVSKRKQLQAFPPNFIHSLDASHMLLTALKCDEMGLTFAAVHDSFWTHAADVDVMNGNIRDAFIRMHSESIVDRLAAEFSARYRDHIHLASVKAGSTVGKKIQTMRKEAGRSIHIKTSAAKLEELRIERLRRRLLASDNVGDREKGAAMVTAASIFEESHDEKELMCTEDLDAKIGELPSARDAKLEANEQLEVGDLSNTRLLDPGTDEFDLDVAQHIEAPTLDLDTKVPGEGDEKVKPSTVARRKYRKSEAKVHFWMSMTFPPVPKKGDFDVSRLKSSQYFFS